MLRREETRIVTAGGVGRVWRWGNGHHAPPLDRALQRGRRAKGRDGGPNSLSLRFQHFKGVHWVSSGGPMAEAYVPVVVHDGCRGCLVCVRTTDWFMEFARLAYRLTRMNLRDCMHWGHLFDNPKPLIVPTSNLLRCNLNDVAALRTTYFSLCESVRPHLREIWPPDQGLSQSERFEDRLTIVRRMVELWEDGQYIGWPT
jgi:hypothetical protein